MTGKHLFSFRLCLVVLITWLLFSCATSRGTLSCDIELIADTFRQVTPYDSVRSKLNSIGVLFREVPAIGISLGDAEKYKFYCHSDSCFIAFVYDKPLLRKYIDSDVQPNAIGFHIYCRSSDQVVGDRSIRWNWYY